MKERMLAEIKATTWYPDWAGSARFYDFVSDARDWCISASGTGGFQYQYGNVLHVMRTVYLGPLQS
jgi:hypothetical protein